jgi:hypothetical protein
MRYTTSYNEVLVGVAVLVITGWTLWVCLSTSPSFNSAFIQLMSRSFQYAARLGG